MFFPNKNPPGYKERVISCIWFEFVGVINMIDYPSNVKLYVSNIVELNKDAIIGHMGNLGTSYFLRYIVQYWSVCAVDEDNQDLTMLM